MRQCITYSHFSLRIITANIAVNTGFVKLNTVASPSVNTYPP